MRKQKGFSLIELLIVVAIILIIAAIAVPNLLRSRMAANEAAAVAALRTIGTASVTYVSTYNRYAPDLTAFSTAAGGATSAAADLLDATMSSAAAPVKSGYTFTYATNATGTTFSGVANPQTRGSTGQQSFCIDHSNAMRKDNTADFTVAATGCPAAQGTAM